MGTKFQKSTVPWTIALSRAHAWSDSINRANRKYGISAVKLRWIHYLAHLVPETGYLALVKEGDSKDGSYLRSKKYYPYYGRGLIQLTWKEEYEKYGEFRVFQKSESEVNFKEIGWNPDELIARNNTDYNAFNCADSAGYFIARKKGMLLCMDHGGATEDGISSSKFVNGNVAIEKLNGLDLRLQTLFHARNVLQDENSDKTPERLSFHWRRNSEKERTGRLDKNGVEIRSFIQTSLPWELDIDVISQTP